MSNFELFIGDLPTRANGYKRKSIVEVTNVDQINDFFLKELMNFYFGLKKSEAGVPLRKHFSPMSFPKHLEYISLLKYVGGDMADPDNYIYKVFGSALVHFYGINLTNKKISDLPIKGLRERTAKSVPLIFADPKPYVALSELVLPDKDFIRSETLVLPFSGSGETADILLTEIRFVHYSNEGEEIKNYNF